VVLSIGVNSNGQIDLGLYSIVMKYAHRQSPGKTIYYRRRIPKGLESYYDGKTFFVKSTGTTDAKLAAAILIRNNTQAERDWDRLRQGLPMSVSEEMNATVGQVLAPCGLNSFVTRMFCSKRRMCCRMALTLNDFKIRIIQSSVALPGGDYSLRTTAFRISNTKMPSIPPRTIDKANISDVLVLL